MTDPKLTRQIGLFDATMIMVGMVIGSGIFLSTGIMAASIPSAGLILLAWIVGGLLTLSGAFIYAELGTAMPQAGGQYVYIQKAYGELVAFLFGWIFFFAYMTGGVASLALAFAEYLAYFFPFLSMDNVLLTVGMEPFSLSAGELMGIGAIALFTLVNLLGVGWGKTIQNVLTVVKIGTILGFVFLAFSIGKTQSMAISAIPPDLSFSQVIGGFVGALIVVSWAFDGWNNVNFVAGEITHPQRNLTLALIFGTFIITGIYIVMNVVYLMSVPVTEIAGVYRVAEVSASALFGGRAAAFISAAVLISVLGALNATILAGARVYYAMARDGLFFSRAARIHPRYRTPAFALLIQAVWSCVLMLSGNLEQVVTYTIFVAIVFWIVAAASLFTLRKKFPDLPRPYKAWGYPVVPALFILASVGILLNTLVEEPVESLSGLGLIAIGIPAYFFWKRRRNEETKTFE
jgi:APA family basic amino acid/polyamine antiporter